MIKSNIKREYPAQITKYNQTDKSVYIADYTKQTNSKKRVKIILENPPSDIQYFSLLNKKRVQIGFIIFDNTSFTGLKGTLPQCECTIFPHTSTDNSWILFLELKYGKAENNEINLNKAIKKLYRTRTYYYQKGIIHKTNTSYLLASIPNQPEPFVNFIMPPNKLQSLKKKHNVVLRLKNSAEIDNNDKIFV